MKKVIFGIIIFTFGACLFSQTAFGGAWTLPKHHLWSEMYFKWHWAKNSYESGSSYGNANFKENNRQARAWGWVMEPKLEFGVTDWLTLLTSLEYKEAKYKEYDRDETWGPFRRKNHGIQYIKIGGKLRVLQKPVVLSAQLKGFIYPGYGNYRGDDPALRNQPSIGNGDDALELRGLIGKEFYLPLYYNDWSLKCYANGEAGYRWKNKEICNDVPFLIETGAWLCKNFLLKGEVDGYLVHGATGSIKSRYAIWRIGGLFAFLGGDPIARRGKQFNIEFQYGQTFAGKNTNADQELVLKLQTQF